MFGRRTEEKETFPVENSDAANTKAQEDYLTMVYGDFLQSDDIRLHYLRKVLGVLSLQVVLNLLVNCLCARFGGFNDLLSNYVAFAAGAFATVGAVVLLAINENNRKELPKAHILAFCFIVGSCVLTVGASQKLNDQFTLLVLYAIASAVVSLFVGALLSGSQNQAHWFM